MEAIYKWLIRYEAVFTAGAVVLLALAVVGAIEGTRL